MNLRLTGLRLHLLPLPSLFPQPTLLAAASRFDSYLSGGLFSQ